MRPIYRLVLLLFVMLGVTGVSSAQLVPQRVACRDFSYSACAERECCRIRCLACDQFETGEALLEGCAETACWTQLR